MKSNINSSLWELLKLKLSTKFSKLILGIVMVSCTIGITIIEYIKDKDICIIPFYIFPIIIILLFISSIISLIIKGTEEEKDKKINTLTSNIGNLNKEVESSKRKITNYEFSIENTQITLKENLHELLIKLYLQEQFNDNCRISVYKNFNNKLYLLERYSRNSILNEHGRSNINLTEGFVGCLQKSDKKYLNLNIDDKYNPNSSSNYYKCIQKICKDRSVEFSNEVIKNLNMKSHHYYLCKLIDNRNEFTGVIVIESESKRFDSILDKLNEFSSLIESQIDNVFEVYYKNNKKVDLNFDEN